MINQPVIRLIRLTIAKYQRDQVGDMAAALSYFAIFSIFPSLLLIVSIVGFVVDPERLDTQELILELTGSAEIADLIVQTLTSFAQTRVGTGLLGIGTLLLSATGLLSTLGRFFDQIWELQPPPEGKSLKRTLLSIIMMRLISFLLIFAVATLILIAVFGNLILSLIFAYTDWLPFNTWLIPISRVLFGIALLTTGFAVLYKMLASQRPAWRDVWPAALAAALAFTLLQRLAEFIFTRVDFSSFGVLGAAMTLLLWIFISFQILLVGGELAFAWSRVFGSQQENAEYPGRKAEGSSRS